MGGETLISFKNVKKSFNGKQVLKGISFEIKKGEIFGIIGKSGIGKTTVLNSMVGYLPIDSGEISFNVRGESKEFEKKICLIKNKTLTLSECMDLVRKEFGFSTQFPSFYNNLSVYENLDFFASIYGVKKEYRKERINKMLELFGLKDSGDALACELSGGMQKRLDIACALIHDPFVLVLDEPTADLDPVLRRGIWELLKKINKAGKTIIIASHFVNELEDVCDRVAILHEGAIIKEEAPTELIDAFIKHFEVVIETREASYEDITRTLLKLPSLEIKKIRKEGKELIIYTSRPQNTLVYALKQINKSKQKIVEAAIRRPSLAEVFETVTKKEAR